MSSSGASSATRGTTESYSNDGSFMIRVNNSNETPTKIFYKKPLIEEITGLSRPFKLQISDDGQNYCFIKCFVGNLKNATKGNYYGPFPILVSGDSSTFELYFPENMCKKLKKWNAETQLYYKNESEICSWIYKYVVDDPACESCDLSLAPTRIQTLAPTITERDFEPSSTSDSESQGPSLIHYDSKIHGVINIKIDSPLVASAEEIKLLYVIPLEEDMQKCLESRKDFPLQFIRSDSSFEIIPGELGNSRDDAFETNDSVFDIKVKRKNGTYTSWECNIPDVPALLEGLLSRTFHFSVENLKNALPGIYYGPYEIFVKDKNENGIKNSSTFKCYFREDMNEELQKLKECHSLQFTNNIGKKTSIYKYVLDLPACKWCDLSYVPTRLPRNTASSSTSSSKTQASSQIDPDPAVFGVMIYKNDFPSTDSDDEVELKYVMPLRRDIIKCLKSKKAYPLQFWRSGGSFCVRPCFPKNARIDSKENNFSLEKIQVINKDGDAEEMGCLIQNLLPLFEREMGCSRECCNYTIIYNDGNKDRTSFTYTKPTYADFTNGPNPHCLEIFNDEKSKKYSVYCGNINTFDPNFIFGPFLIQSVYDDGTRGPWLDCYFRNNPGSRQVEAMIDRIEQELEFEEIDFKFKENPIEGIERDKTSIISFMDKGCRFITVKRTIKVHDFPGNGSCGSEI